VQKLSMPPLDRILGTGYGHACCAVTVKSRSYMCVAGLDTEIRT
jgi:hypothetical protein